MESARKPSLASRPSFHDTSAAADLFGTAAPDRPGRRQDRCLQQNIRRLLGGVEPTGHTRRRLGRVPHDRRPAWIVWLLLEAPDELELAEDLRPSRVDVVGVAAQCLAGHQGVRRRGPLPHIDIVGDNGDAAVGGDPHLRHHRVGARAEILHRERGADTVALIVGREPLLIGGAVLPQRMSQGLVADHAEPGRRARRAGDDRISRLQEVELPEFERVEPARDGDLVDHRLDRECRLERAEAAHRAGNLRHWCAWRETRCRREARDTRPFPKCRSRCRHRR